MAAKHLKKFVGYCKSHPRCFIHDKIDLYQFSNMGIGVKALDSIDKGQVLLKIPRDLWYPLSVECSWGDLQNQNPEMCNSLIEFTKEKRIEKGSAAPLLIGSVSLIVHLIKELENPISVCSDHLEVIPKTVVSPLFWSETQMSELQASPLRRKVYSRRQLISEVYHRIVADHYGSIISAPNFAWAWTLILSRAISSIHEKIPFSIVPYLDMFNHSSDKNIPGFCRHDYDAQTQQFIVSCETGAPAGSQLFINYGDHPNSKLLDLYGFCIDNNPNGQVISNYDDNIRFLATVGGEHKVLTGSTANDSDVAFYAVNSLSRYATTLFEDKLMLENEKQSDSLNLELAQALQVRIEEKKCLKNTLKTFSNQLF